MKMKDRQSLIECRRHMRMLLAIGETIAEILHEADVDGDVAWQDVAALVDRARESLILLDLKTKKQAVKAWSEGQGAGV